MKKQILAVTLLVGASLLLGTTAFAQTNNNNCSDGVNLRFVGAGSSAQINALGYAAANLELAAHDEYALITFKTATITDQRANVTDTGLTAFVVWDPSASTTACDAYVYFQTDSGVGDKDFFAYEKYTATASTVTSKQHFSSIGAAWATVPTTTFTAANVIKGMTDGCWFGAINGGTSAKTCTGGSTVNEIPATISAALNTSPQTYVNQPVPPAAPAYCGNVSTVAVTSQYYCYFNAAGTDVRPEDALYAFNRALTTYNGIVPPATKGGTGLTGFGYGTGDGCATGTADIGCPFVDSFNQGSEFFVVKWGLSGTDPISGGTLPAYSTLSVGAAPLVVIAGNEDTANLGSTFTDAFGHTNYNYNNINRQTLVQLYSGYSSCLSDLQSSSAGTSVTGAGIPLQVVEREALSGTYNAFEWTAVRTQQGGPLSLVSTPDANADGGQEQFNDPAVFPSHFGTIGDCTYQGTINSIGVAYPQSNCFNPMFLTNSTDIKAGSNCKGAAGGTAPGLPVRLRGIGSGELVKAVIGSFNVSGSSGSGSATVFNPIGYAFWSYGNLNALCKTISNTSCTGGFLGHYLTVDGIDPIYTTPGGEFDATPNPSGAFNPPVCSFTVTCPTIPFTHLKDGTYPLWSILRTVTFAPVKGKVATPAGVLDMIANEEITAGCAPGSTTCTYLPDYVPFLNNIAGSNGVYTGNLNLFVYRSHYKQTGATINPANGHSACKGDFTGVSLAGGTSAAATCLVDFGNDAGGSVLTVQSDVDFVADFGVEEFGLRQ